MSLDRSFTPANAGSPGSPPAAASDRRFVVTVIAIRGWNVRLGIDAPKSVPVHRKEVYDSISAGLSFGKRLGKPR